MSVSRTIRTRPYLRHQLLEQLRVKLVLSTEPLDEGIVVGRDMLLQKQRALPSQRQCQMGEV